MTTEVGRIKFCKIINNGERVKRKKLFSLCHIQEQSWLVSCPVEVSDSTDKRKSFFTLEVEEEPRKCCLRCSPGASCQGEGEAFKIRPFCCRFRVWFRSLTKPPNLHNCIKYLYVICMSCPNAINSVICNT